MRIFANKKIKQLFQKILLLMLVFFIIAAVCISLQLKYRIMYLLVAATVIGCCFFVLLYRYFKEQNDIMEAAVIKLQEYIAGDENARLQCDEEGELYRLFHEVNNLAAILSAHAKKEGSAKVFLKNTISDISHQLKTPLAALNIYNGIMQEETRDFPALAEFSVQSEQELDRIETLVQNLLKISKLDAKTIMLDKHNENIAEMMEGIERHFSYRAKQENKQLSLKGSEEVTLFCDRNWLMEAVSNIVKNAFDHTEEENTIEIEWKQFASILQIRIKDDGSGIHPEDINHIFQRFYRSQFSKDTQGTGLGLPLAKAIVEEHSGTIEVDSQLGKGAAFILNFLIPTKL